MDWHYASGEKTVGPVPLAEVVRLIDQGALPRDVQVWRPGQPTWYPAAAVPEIAGALAPLQLAAPSVQFRCPYCSSSQPPVRLTKVSAGGWVLFWVLLFFTCALLCWIGLLIREEYTVCSSCGIKLG